MDHRIALKPNTPLFLRNDRGEAIHCIVEREIGRGGSCIVYEAARITDTGDKTLYRIKEFYPYKLNIARNENDLLIPSAKDAAAFEQWQEQFRSDFSRTNHLFYSDANYSSMTNQLDVFRLNGTSYILSAYSSRKTLATYKPESLKECIALVRQAAQILVHLHRQGYLYLDTKPDNILIVDGYEKQIQLFDFDSLLSIQEICQTDKLHRNDIRLSYSKGFAPIELQTSKINRLGPHTDVYSIGALLFYLLFGHTPTAPDCETDAEFDFSKIQYDYRKCDDRLFYSLRSFFHSTLAVYYADRCQSMKEAVSQLQKIESYADPVLPRIYSTQIPKSRIFYGREREFSELDAFWENPNCNCLFITGMGGIGKSTFIREYLTRRKAEFHTVLYVYYKDSIEATISNDDNIEINTLKQSEQAQTGTRYFDEKIRKIRELVRDTSSILVIDNFTGDFDDDLKLLLSTGLKVILLRREAASYQNCQELKLAAASDQNTLRRIFEANLGRSISFDEQESFEQILKHIEGHTLLLELIAKQIANSHITVSSAASLTNAYGFSAIAPEKVDYEKDSTPTRNTIGNIIDALFKSNSLSEEKKIIMKVCALLGDYGISIHWFQQIMNLSSKDDLNELVKDGWLTLTGDSISMHHVIREAVHRWVWTPAGIRAAEQFLTYFYTEIHLESEKNNYPKRLQKRITSGNNLPADIEKLTKLLSHAEDIIPQCQQEKTIYTSKPFANLQLTVLLNMPRYRENFIFSETSRILAVNVAKNQMSDALATMRVYELVFSIHSAHKDKDAMRDVLDHAYAASRQSRNKKARAIYYNMVSDYYDFLLNGFYDTEDPCEEHLLNKMLDAIEKTLHYAKRSRCCDDSHLYAKNILAKATILMRSGRGTAKEISKLIGVAKKTIAENASQYADVRLHYYLVCAWYSALVLDDAPAADAFIQDARNLSDLIIPTDLQKIEDVLIPCANIFFELNCPGKAMNLLYEGTRLCVKHTNMDSYARTRQELYDHFFEVGIEAQQYNLCQRVLTLIETENAEIVDPKNRVIVPADVRSIITGKIT